MATARAHLAKLIAKVDAFFERVHAHVAGDRGITCHAGCDACCRRRFSVTAIEAEVLAEALEALPATTLHALDAHEGVEACAALLPNGRCAVYEARPLVCRSHGLPIRFGPERAGSLPIVDACHLNFTNCDLTSLPADCVLDQSTMSTILGALDAARAAEVGRSPGQRIEIAALVRQSQSAAPSGQPRG